MTIEQISVFMENRPGQLAEITRALSEAGIDLRALNVAETTDYGVLRLITSDTRRAADILREQGHVVMLSPVFALAVPDRPGGLCEVLHLLAEKEVDIEYMYSVFGHRDGKAYMIFCVKNAQIMEKAVAQCALTAAGSVELGIS